MLKLFKPKSKLPIDKSTLPASPDDWELRARLLQSKMLEYDGSVKPKDTHDWLWRSYLRVYRLSFIKSLWITMPLYLAWAYGAGVTHAQFYGNAALTHAPFIYTLACGNLSALGWTLYLALLLSIFPISYAYFPDTLHINRRGFSFGDQRRTIPWDKVQLAETEILLYRSMRHSTVLKLYLEPQPYSKRLNIFEKIHEHFKIYALKREHQYLQPQTKRNPENPYESVCLLLPLELFGFDVDCQKFLKALKDYAPPGALQGDLTMSTSSSDGQNYTALWLDQLRSPQNANTSRILEEGHSLQNGKYIVAGVLGYGGFSVVYAAQSVSPSLAPLEGAPGLTGVSLVAIKEVVINSGGSRVSKEAMLRQIVSEIELLKTLDHPNIVKCLDYFIDSGRVYIVMQALEGGNLREIVNQGGALQEKQLVEIGLQCCSILDYLHTLPKPLMHRDFTPDNLIWDGHTVKLVDFNVAEEANTMSSPTIVGKHSFLASEQWCGNFTPAGDLYQLGCSLYFLATANDPEPLSQSDPASLRPDLSSEFCQIVRVLTEQEMSDRYATAHDTAEKLRLLQEAC